MSKMKDMAMTIEELRSAAAAIYEILPEILELWGSNLVTDVASKKNSSAAAVK